MMCGSSAGGLIAILLGRLRLDCATAITVYKELTASFCGKEEDKFYNEVLDKDFLETNEFDIALAKIVGKHGGQVDLPVISGGQGTKVAFPFLSSLSEDTDVILFQTFVTVVAGEPDYFNQTHLIRTYPAPTWSTGSLLPPVKHIWLVREAVRATLSSPMYMPPARIEPMYGFSDAGFAGFNNPIERARKECKTLWPADNPDDFVFVSIGTGLGSLSRRVMMKNSIVTERHAAPLVKPMMEKISADFRTQAKEGKALAIMRHLLMIALETQDAHNKLLQAQTKANYYRLDPELGLAEVDLCDIFYQEKVERKANEWANGEGKELVAEIAEKLRTLSIADMEHPKLEKGKANPEKRRTQSTLIAPRDMEPPKPEKGTVNPGYNPQLDKKRPSTMADYLQ